jgi:beta-N-acetylhexosaminidase
MQNRMGRRELCLSLAAGLTSPRLQGSPRAELGRASASVRAMSLDEKIGQLICGRLDPRDSKQAEELAASGRAGSFIGLLAGMGSAKAAAEFLNHLQGIARHPLLFVGEQEHGSHRNVAGGTEFPAYMAFGAARSKELAYQFGKINTLEGRAVGYNWISCPTLDVNIEPGNPIINTRSLGDRPELVTELGVESCRGIVQNRGLTCICHYPGHGATSRDSHVELPTVNRSREELEAVELAPYRAGIRAGFMNCIMTAHNLYPALEPERGVPATLSKKIITGLLREKLGFRGIVATDSLAMKAVAGNFSPGDMALKAVAAGCDILLGPDVASTAAALKRAVESGKLPLRQLEDSVTRIVEAKEWLGLLRRSTVDVSAADGTVGRPEHKEVARQVARASITVLRNDGLPLAAAGKLLVIAAAGWGDLGPAHPGINGHFVDQVRKRRPQARNILIEEKGQSWDEAWAEARNADAVILAVSTRIRSYSEESLRINREIFEQSRRIAELGKHVSLVVADNPYVVPALPETPVCLCTYSNCPDSMTAAAEVLFGEIKSTGKLPVTLSDRYRFGYGLG